MWVLTFDIKLLYGWMEDDQDDDDVDNGLYLLEFMNLQCVFLVLFVANYYSYSHCYYC